MFKENRANSISLKGNSWYKRSYYLNTNNSVKNINEIEDKNKVDDIGNELKIIYQTLKK